MACYRHGVLKHKDIEEEFEKNDYGSVVTNHRQVLHFPTGQVTTLPTTVATAVCVVSWGGGTCTCVLCLTSVAAKGED